MTNYSPVYPIFTSPGYYANFNYVDHQAPAPLPRVPDRYNYLQRPSYDYYISSTSRYHYVTISNGQVNEPLFL